MQGLKVMVVAALLGGCAADDGETELPLLLSDEVATPAQPARYDLSCHGSELPQRAADPVQLGAFNYDSYAIELLPDAVVDLVRISDDMIVERAVSDASGETVFEIATDGAPFDHYTRTQRVGYVDSYLYPSGPLVADEDNRALPLLGPAWRDELAGYAGVKLDPTRGIVEVIVTDCLGYRVEGATVTFEPAGDTVAYWDATFTDASATATTDNGHAWAFNVPAGEVEATITYGDLTWRARPVQSFADARTLSWRAP